MTHEEIMKERDKEGVRLLRRELRRHNYNYYVLNQPTISDYEYDMMVKRLEDLERKYPEFDSPDSPTHQVGSDLISQQSYIRKREDQKMSNDEAVRYLKQYPHWNIQEQKDILDSINDWSYHKYVCIMKDGKVCEWRGINDEHYDGSIETHICTLNEEEYNIDDILYWTELK